MRGETAMAWRLRAATRSLMSASRALTSSLKASTVLLAGARGRELRPWVVKQQVSPFKYAVKIVVDDPDPSKFQTGAQASAAIYTDG